MSVFTFGFVDDLYNDVKLLNRQHSIDSQRSGSLLRSSSVKEKEVDGRNKKLIEIEKTETGSVSMELRICKIFTDPTFCVNR